jgi:hypothetical protein
LLIFTLRHLIEGGGGSLPRLHLTWLATPRNAEQEEENEGAVADDDEDDYNEFLAQESACFCLSYCLLRFLRWYLPRLLLGDPSQASSTQTISEESS